MNHWIKKFLPLVAILIITAWVFSPSLENQFIDDWDDDLHILRNEKIEKLDGESLTSFFTEAYVAMLQPVTMLSYTLNYKLGERDPRGYHLINYGLHLVAVILLYLLLLKLSGSTVGAVAGTIIFAIHPFAAESAVWVSGRLAQFAIIFMLAAMVHYTRNTKPKFLILLLFYILAILSKITAILLPLYLFVIDFFVYGKKVLSWQNHRQKVLLTLCALPILFYGMTLREPQAGQELSSILANIPIKYLWYINHLVPVYENSPVYSSPEWLDWRNAIGLVLLGLFVFTYRKATKPDQNLILAGAAIFLLVLLPHQVEFSQGAPVGDRYGHLSYIGGAIALSGMAGVVMGAKKSARLAFGGIFLVLITLHALAANHYTKKWYDAESLWSHVAKTQPKSSVARGKIGGVFLKNHRYDEAYQELVAAVTLDEGNENAWYNLGSTQYYLNEREKAVESFSRAINLVPTHGFYLGRAKSHLALKNYSDAINDLNVSIFKEPTSEAFYFRGLAKVLSGQPGCKDLEAAIGLEGGLPEKAIEKYCN